MRQPKGPRATSHQRVGDRRYDAPLFRFLVLASWLDLQAERLGFENLPCGVPDLGLLGVLRRNEGWRAQH